MATTSTRAQIRRRICRRTGDCLVLTATATGTTTTLIDAINLNQENNSLQNRIGIVTAGTVGNLYSVIRVSGNTKSTFTLTFANTALGNNTAAGDVMELFNERDEGSTVDEIHDVINHAIINAGEQALGPATDDPQDFAWNEPVIDAPATWEGFTGVDVEDDDGIWHALPTNSGVLYVDRDNRTIELKGSNRGIADGKRIRLRGVDLPQTLANDFDTTTVDAEWLEYECSAALLDARAHRDGDKSLSDRAFRLQTKADALRSKTRLFIPGRFWRFR